MGVLDKIKEQFIIAIIRGAEPEEVMPTVKALYDGGVRVLEMTATTPKVMSLIEKVRVEMPDDLMVGAGTVLDPETARAAILSGAEFILSPTLKAETITLTKRYGVVSIPGAMTPTEILTAFEQGADMVKVFPSGGLGPKFLQDVKGPLPQIPLVPTGGVGLHNVGEYVKAGAAAAGIGSSLYQPPEELTEQFLLDLKEKAEKFVHEIQKARD